MHQQNEKEVKKKSKRGFASMDPEKLREIAKKGGQIAHQMGRAHKFTPEEARVAGKLGGYKVSQNREHMSRIGTLGGESQRQRKEKYNKEKENE